MRNFSTRRGFAAGPIFVSLLVLKVTTARASSPPPADADPGAPPDPCAARSWTLDGAAAQPGEEGRSDLPETWKPAVTAIAGCLVRPEADRACVLVQGHFDTLGFSPSVVTAFGGLPAAQQARARGRAARVLQELVAAGAPPERLRELAPPAEPTFRGVSVSWRADCTPAPAALGAEDRRVIEEARRLLEGHRNIDSASVSAAAPAPPAPAGPSPFFVEGAVHASAGFGAPATVVSPGLRAALGLRTGPLVSRIGVGGTAATRAEQRLAGEAFLGAAYRVLSWLEVGPAAGIRVGGPDPVEPWLERAWFAGLEATECPFAPWEGVGLCFQQAVLPLGGQLRRGEVENAGIVRIPAETSHRTRLELSVALRDDL